jgi:hypothetical protein
MVGRLADDLEPVGEFHTENQFWQLVVAIEASAATARPCLVKPRIEAPSFGPGLQPRPTSSSRWRSGRA